MEALNTKSPKINSFALKIETASHFFRGFLNSKLFQLMNSYEKFSLHPEEHFKNNQFFISKFWEENKKTPFSSNRSTGYYVEDYLTNFLFTYCQETFTSKQK